MFRITESFSAFIKEYPVTTAIAFICLLQGAVTMLLSGYTAETRLLLGAYDANAVDDGAYWRLLTYAFGHMSLFHLLLNIPFVVLLARPLEKRMGHSLFLLSYVILSIGAGMTIHFFSSYPVPLAGSSGPAFGLIGIYLYLIWQQKQLIARSDRSSILLFSSIAFLSTFLISTISIAGHLGGLISGFIFALVVSLRSGSFSKL